MRSLLLSNPAVATILVALVALIAFGAHLADADATAAEPSSVEPNLEVSLLDGSEVAAGGPPSCAGFSLGDPCITRKNLAECRSALAQCGGDESKLLVLQSCPLQFRCGG